MKILRNLKYLLWYFRIKNLEENLQKDFFTKFNKTKKVTMYYIAVKEEGTQTL